MGNDIVISIDGDLVLPRRDEQRIIIVIDDGCVEDPCLGSGELRGQAEPF